MLRLEERGDVLSIKFSPASDVLALQRSPNGVEFINFTNGQPNSHYFPTSKVWSLVSIFWLTSKLIFRVKTAKSWDSFGPTLMKWFS